MEFKIKYFKIFKDIIRGKISLKEIKLSLLLADLYYKYHTYITPFDSSKEILSIIKTIKNTIDKFTPQDYLRIMKLYNEYCEPKFKFLNIVELGAFMNKLKELSK